MEFRARHPVGRAQAAARRPRARDVPALHLSHRGRVHRRRRADALDEPHQPGLLRGQAVPRHPGDGRGAPHGRLPQARARQRRRIGQGQRLQRAGTEEDFRRAELLGADRPAASAGRGLRADDFSPGRVHRAEPRGPGNFPPLHAGRVAPRRLRHDASAHAAQVAPRTGRRRFTPSSTTPSASCSKSSASPSRSSRWRC